MSSLSNIYIKVETLETLLATVKKKGEKGISIDISINEESNDYGQNLSAYVSQTKEQREEKVKRFYIGNGKCFWTDGKIEIAKKKEVHEATPLANNEADDDLPF
jgi:CRISPR/Cas system Type II protein with McrA/HNH and RuvC-like nuclease domain